MPQTGLPNIGVNYDYDLGSSDTKNGRDSSHVLVDWAAQAFVIDERTAEPGSPNVGDAYLLGVTQTGVNWGSDTGAAAGSIAIYTNVPGQTDSSPWLYRAPREGFSVWDRSRRVPLAYDATEARWISWANNRQGVTVIDDNGGDYTPALADENQLIVLSALFDTADAIVLPLDSAVPYAPGTTLQVQNGAGGAVTLTTTGLTFVGTAPGGTIANGEGVRIVKVSGDSWALA